MYVGAIDIGGSKTVASVINESGELLARKKLGTKREYKEHFADCTAALQQCCGELGIAFADLKGLGVVPPGMVSGNTLLFAPSIGWRDIDMVESFRKATGIENVATEGDVNACGIAEAYFGGFDDLFWMTVSNGIGGAIVSGGKIFRGHNDVAGEIGHIKVEYERPRRCPCGQSGCAEAMASGAGIGARVRDEAADDKTFAAAFAAAGLEQDAAGCAQLARDGNEKAAGIMYLSGVYIGRALAAALNMVNPARVFIGGGVAASLDLLMEPIRRTLDGCCVEFARNIPIERTRLGYDAASRGAAALILSDSWR